MESTSENIQLKNNNTVRRYTKFKKKYLIFIIPILFILLLLVLIKKNFLFTSEKAHIQAYKNQVEKTSSTSANYLRILPTNIDPNTEILFAENKTIYSLPLDGSQPKRFSEMEDFIYSLSISENRNAIFIDTINPDVIGQERDDPDRTRPAYKRSWIMQKKQTHALEISTNFLEPTRLSYYTVSSTNSADIIYNPFDGTEPEKIGTLTQKPITALGCDAGCSPENLYYSKYPYGFTPSPDGKYLLSKPSPGGGLGEPAVLLSRDGSKRYPIDFYWFTSGAVWIDNNKILTHDGSKTKLFTIDPNGLVNTQILSKTILDATEIPRQMDVSPDLKYLYSQGSIISLDNFKVEKLPTLQGKFLGWSKNSKNLLFADYYFPKTQKDKTSVYIFNLPSQKLIKIAKFSGIPSWRVVNGSEYPTQAFVIR